MSRRRPTHRANCAEPGCREGTFWEYDNLTEQRDHLRLLAKRPWRCSRHSQPRTVLSADENEREQVLVASRVRDLPGLFWVAEGTKSGSGFAHGPGFRAFAKDFPPGTRLVITARIESPAEANP